MNKPLAASAVLLGYTAALWVKSERDGLDLGDTLADQASALASLIDRGTFGMVKVSHIRRATPDLLGNANIRALLAVIRTGEGTAGGDGYRTLFGGGMFSSLADHPRRSVTKSGYTSTAAGAYQFLTSTWDETAAVLGLADFSAASQDLAAVGRIAARGALADILAGRFDLALKKIAREWASLPGSPYGQPTISLDRARSVYQAEGGRFGATA